MNRRSLIAAFAILGCTAGLGTAIAAQSPHSHQHSFGDAEKWAKIFDDPKRDAWQKPAEVIKALELKSDAVVADIGAGTGYFSARLARAVMNGRIYAIDIEPDMVKHLGERARREGLKNMSAVTAAPDDPRLPGKADVILLVNAYHHVDDRERYFGRLAEALKPGGRLVILDFRMDSPVGPPKSGRMEPQRVKTELARAGFELREEHAFLPYQYFLVFQPTKR